MKSFSVFIVHFRAVLISFFIFIFFICLNKYKLRISACILPSTGYCPYYPKDNATCPVKTQNIKDCKINWHHTSGTKLKVKSTGGVVGVPEHFNDN